MGHTVGMLGLNLCPRSWWKLGRGTKVPDGVIWHGGGGRDSKSGQQCNRHRTQGQIFVPTAKLICPICKMYLSEFQNVDGQITRWGYMGGGGCGAGGDSKSDQERNRRRTQGLAPGSPPPPHSLHSINHIHKLYPPPLYLYFWINQILASFHTTLLCQKMSSKIKTTLAANINWRGKHDQGWCSKGVFDIGWSIELERSGIGISRGVGMVYMM